MVNMQGLLEKYPLKRINPFDGMAITAQVWQEAHNFHQQSHSFLTMLSHGPGIVAGLQVIASDPPDTSVYILPGVAIDPAGQVIVLPQPVSYDIGDDLAGPLYLLIGYHESRPRPANGSQIEGEPLYVQAEFSITAQSEIPDAPRVELARVMRSSRTSLFKDARNPAAPGPDEIDGRNRRHVGALPAASIAVCYLGRVEIKKHGRGASFLAQTINHLGRSFVQVADDVPLGPGLLTHSLVYLVGQGEFSLDPGEMNGLRNYVRRRRGTLFIESLDSQAEAAFWKFLREKELQPDLVTSDHPLLCQPYLFAMPPIGFEGRNEPKLLAGEGVIFSTYNYGLLWQGERRSGPAEREDIRAATELGHNIVAYALSRQR